MEFWTVNSLLNRCFGSQPLPGNLFIDRLRVDNRLVGDMFLFDSRILIRRTIEFKHPDPRTPQILSSIHRYWKTTKIGGTDVLIKGWVRAPDQDTTPADTLYYF